MNILLASFDLFRRKYRKIEMEKKIENSKLGLYALRIYDKTTLKKAYFIATIQLAGGDIRIGEELLRTILKEDKPLIVALRRDQKVYFYRFAPIDIECNHSVRFERQGVMVYFSIKLGTSLQEPKVENMMLDTLKKQFDLAFVREENKSVMRTPELAD
jgi:hypothetical protein